MRDCEKGHVLDIRIMFGLVGHDVVYIVTSLPPSQAQPSKIVGNDDSNHSVNMKVVCDTHVSSIMGGENELMPEAPEPKTGHRPPTHSQKDV